MMTDRRRRRSAYRRRCGYTRTVLPTVAAAGSPVAELAHHAGADELRVRAWLWRRLGIGPARNGGTA